MKADKLVMRWTKRIFLMRISVPIILICAILSFSVIGITIYGNNVGNFVIKVEDPRGIGLALSEVDDFDRGGGSKLLAGPSLENAWNTTYADILERAAANDVELAGMEGDYTRIIPSAEAAKHDTFIAYGFYLKNTSEFTGSYAMDISMYVETRNLSKALRILIITDGRANIYGRASDDGTPINGIQIPDAQNYEVEAFPFVTQDGKTVLVEQTANIGGGQLIKFTVVMWLEGWDEDCKDNLRGGSIRMDMNFVAIG
jgi:hypothetical protein